MHPRALRSYHWRNGKAYARPWIDGRRTWWMLLDERGQPITNKQNAAEARRALERLRDELKKPKPEAAPRQRAHLGEWLDDEYSGLLRARLATEDGYDQAAAYVVLFATWLQQRHGDAWIDAVTRPDVEHFCAAFLAGELRVIGSGPCKASYLRGVVNVLRRTWSDAIERGLAQTNPWRKAPIPRIEETHVPWVAPEALVALYDEVHPTQRDLVVLVGETGLRPSEALALGREDLDLARGVVHVRRGKTRGSRRTVPLTARAISLLESLPQRADGFVLRPRDTQVTARALKTACAHRHLPPLTLRSLRHAYASHLIVGGTPPTVVASLLGHVDGGALVLRLYGRWFPHDAQARAVAGLAAFRHTPAPAAEELLRPRGKWHAPITAARLASSDAEHVRAGTAEVPLHSAVEDLAS
jgi:integrase